MIRIGAGGLDPAAGQDQGAQPDGEQRGQAGPGEVLLKIRGGTEAYLARSINPIPKGATVLVIENRGTRTVDVSEWADPLDPFPASPR